MPKKKLTTKSYWENYYKAKHTDKFHIINVCSFYDEYWDMFFGKNPKGKKLIEIGGFPGRYLSYLSSKYGVVPTCLDYNSDASQIRETFDVMNVKDFEIIQDDFTSYIPQKHYDFVLSNGFVEHFEHFDEILDMHVTYLNENGKLLIMIPNMCGYIKLYKYLVDKKNLEIHNLKSMSLEVFRRFAERHDLRVSLLTYFGDFPHAVHQNLNTVQKIIYKSHRIFFKKWGNIVVNKYPSRLYSSGIIGIFEK